MVNHKTWRNALRGLLLVGAAAGTLTAAGVPPAPRNMTPVVNGVKPPRDMKQMLHDVSKGSIEAPAKVILAGTVGTPASAVNPRVQPGLVHWHPSLEVARTAARKSGKPVLLFQMMGRLDQEFC